MTEGERRTSGLFDRIGAAPELIPGIAAVAVFGFWTAYDGGVFPTDSYPGSLFLLGLLGATAYGYRTRLSGLPRLVSVAIGLLAAFAVWNFLSITWADDQGAAWDGANRCLLYLTVFTLFALPPWSARSAALLIGLYAVAMAATAAINLLGAAGSSEPLDYLIADRFSKPTGYHNANAALFTAAIFPAMLLASRREVPAPLRGLLLASAGVLFDFALLPQSRGWLVAAPLALVAYLVLTPDRVRSLIVLAPLAAVGALTASPMLDVFDAAGEPGGVAGALDQARDAMLIGAAALFAAGALIGVVDGRLTLSEARARLGRRAIGGLAWVGAVAGAVVAIALIGNPFSWAEDRWEDFKSGESPAERESSGGSRLTEGIGSNRYDFWRVAVDEFADSPVTGVGSENFAEDYVRDRDSDEEPAHPHSLPLRVLAQTGLIGALIFAAFLVSALGGLARARLRSPVPLSRGIAGSIAVVVVYWSLHSSGDWFWAYPAISAPVFAWLGLGMRLEGGREPSPSPSARWPLPVAGAIAGVIAVAAISLLLPWTAAVDVKRAAESWGSDPEAAFDRLDRASDLNFLSAQPDLVAGAIATRLNDPERAREAFDRALERDPRNWYATLELAAIDALEGDRQSSLERLQRVAELNPLEPLTGKVRQGAVSGNPVSLEELDSAYLNRYCARQGRRATPTGCDPG